MTPIDHQHTGLDSPKVNVTDLEVDRVSLTTKVSTALSTGGAAVLSTSDSAVIDNMRTRINDLETALIALGLLK